MSYGKGSEGEARNVIKGRGEKGRGDVEREYKMGGKDKNGLQREIREKKEAVTEKETIERRRN